MLLLLFFFSNEHLAEKGELQTIICKTFFGNRYLRSHRNNEI